MLLDSNSMINFLGHLGLICHCSIIDQNVTCAYMYMYMYMYLFVGYHLACKMSLI